MDKQITDKISQKLWDKHQVKENEVVECFDNCEGAFLIDDRPEHQTDPPTFWFVAQTDHERWLKIVFVYYIEDDVAIIKSAYGADQVVIDLYNRRKLE